MNDIEELRSGLVKMDKTRSMRECLKKLDECMLWLSADIETYLLVRKAVGALPVQMRKIIELAMQGKKNAEIAAELSISEGTVHTLKKTAYKKLRDRLQEHFYLLLFWI